MAYDPTMSLDPTTKQSRTFAASSDLLPVTAFGRIRLALTNPTGSGRLIHLIAMTATNASTMPGSIKVWHNPTSGIPTTVAPVAAKNCYMLATPNAIQVGKAICYADVGGAFATLSAGNTALPAMLGGSAFPPLGLPAQSHETYNLSPFLLDPGTTMGFDASFGGLSVTGNSILSVYWWEEG